MKSIQVSALLILLASILLSANISYTGASTAEIIENLPEIHENCQQAIRTLTQHWNAAWHQIKPFMLYLMLRAHEHRLPLARQIYNLIHDKQHDKNNDSSHTT